MDVQGSQFHLVHGLDDWGCCADAATGLALRAEWTQKAIAPAPGRPARWSTTKP